MVSTESINHLPYCIQVKTILSASWLTDIEHRQTVKIQTRHCGNRIHTVSLLSHVAQSLTCLATDASLTADPGVASSMPARSHTFMEINHEIISMVILLPSAESFKKDCCQLQAKVFARSTGLLLVQACPRQSVARGTDPPAMTIAVDLGRKPTK